jgi:hypothetical protein
VVVQSGKKIEPEPLTHGRGLDPEGEMIQGLQKRLESLEERLQGIESADGYKPSGEKSKSSDAAI